MAKASVSRRPDRETIGGRKFGNKRCLLRKAKKCFLWWWCECKCCSLAPLFVCPGHSMSEFHLKLASFGNSTSTLFSQFIHLLSSVRKEGWGPAQTGLSSQTTIGRKCEMIWCEASAVVKRCAKWFRKFVPYRFIGKFRRLNCVRVFWLQVSFETLLCVTELMISSDRISNCSKSFTAPQTVFDKSNLKMAKESLKRYLHTNPFDLIRWIRSWLLELCVTKQDGLCLQSEVRFWSTTIRISVWVNNKTLFFYLFLFQNDSTLIACVRWWFGRKFSSNKKTHVFHVDFEMHANLCLIFGLQIYLLWCNRSILKVSLTQNDAT